MRPVLILSLVLLAAAPHAGRAKTLWEMLGDTGLTAEDLDLMQASAAKLTATAKPKAGSQASWSNPKTQAGGKTEITQVQGSCVTIRQLFHTRQNPQPQPVITQRCRLADGTWELR